MLGRISADNVIEELVLCMSFNADNVIGKSPESLLAIDEVLTRPGRQFSGKAVIRFRLYGRGGGYGGGTAEGPLPNMFRFLQISLPALHASNSLVLENVSGACICTS